MHRWQASGSTLALEPRPDVIKSSNQWLHTKGPPKFLKKISHFPLLSLYSSNWSILKVLSGVFKLSVCELLSVCYRWIRRLVLSSLGLVTCANCSRASTGNKTFSSSQQLRFITSNPSTSRQNVFTELYGPEALIMHVWITKVPGAFCVVFKQRLNGWSWPLIGRRMVHQRDHKWWVTDHS